ncbi:hypothetical protein LCGC14_0925730 [marine sediment metagenome]|uniref:Uncharacterized protein n=1 Tax=marine sediment metagenome TaxID=412755 RepID=A0A0F9RW27_9ZZZZ
MNFTCTRCLNKHAGYGEIDRPMYKLTYEEKGLYLCKQCKRDLELIGMNDVKIHSFMQKHFIGI